ncbi:MAG: YdcH family protein [Rhodobacteraceae bacterium]|nr:YdcH family protein [Paracoccaceae bacterium]
MSNTPHELHEDFPAEADRIHALKTTNAHFARLAEEYHSVNRDVHRAESGVEPVSEQTETKMRRKRAHLKDEIARMLASG